MSLFRPSQPLLGLFGGKKKPGNSNPRYSSRDPRAMAAANAAANSGSKLRYMLPVSLMIVFASVIYVVTESQKRKESGVCIDCDRQKQIAQEIYFNKRIKD